MKHSKKSLIFSVVFFLIGILFLANFVLNRSKKTEELPADPSNPIKVESVIIASPAPEVKEIIPAVPSDPALVEPYILVAEQDDITAFDLLQQNAQINYKMYDFGFFVEDINGIKSSSDYFWAFYVNGVKAEKGADQIRLKVGDKTEWKYEKVE